MAQIIIGEITFDDPAAGLPRNPGALEIEWGYDHRVREYPIAGYKDKTQVTSNEVLLKCTITIRTTDANDGHFKFKQLQALIAKPGPYLIQNSVWGPIEMYLKSPKFRQKAGEDNWVGTWTLPFVEKYD